MVQGRLVLSTRDMVTIAVISGLGGVMSAYVGYLANLFNAFVGVPFGAGQFLAGLHVFWILLARGITGKTGAGTATGLLRGMVELLAGSVHGIVVVLISLFEGVVADVLLLKFDSTDRLGYLLAGGFATASNVFAFQLLFLSGMPLTFILVIGLMAFASGVIFAGYFAHSLLVSLADTGVLPSQEARTSSRWRALAGYAMLGIFLGGSIWYYSAVYSTGSQEGVEIIGLVEEPYTYRQADFEEQLTVVEAELKGSYMYVEPRNYTGVPLSFIVCAAEPLEDAREVVLVASDGYSVRLPLDRVEEDASMILVEEGDGVRLVGRNLDGSQWVRGIVRVDLR